MSQDESRASARLSPDEAFTLLGNETRLTILRSLGRAEGPLSFTELRNTVGIRQGAQFNYHLDKLVGHFVSKTDDGYTLRKPGRRVIEAILSGAITEDPVIEPTEIDFSCRHCGGTVKLGFSNERTEFYCTECPGHYGSSVRNRTSIEEPGRLGGFDLPAAGVQGRTPQEVLRASSLWGHLEALAAAYDVCPRCSAVLEKSVQVCEEHDIDDGLCEACDHRHAVKVWKRCTNCIYEHGGMAVNSLIASPELRKFVTEHGIRPIRDGVEWGWSYDEEIRSTNPLVADFTFRMDGDSITLTTDEELNVVDVSRATENERDDTPNGCREEQSE